MVCGERILESPKVDAVFAAHAWPEIMAGEVHIAARCAFGYAGGFQIKVTGRGGHGSLPHQCVDPIAAANQIYAGLQQIVSRQLPETSAMALSVCTIHSGPQDKSNIIPDTCTMTGTIRSDRKEVMEDMIIRMKRTAEKIAEACGASAEVEARYGNAVLNAPELIPLFRTSAAKIIGEENVKIDHEPHLGGEDFSEYTSRVPGVYVFAGIATEKNRGKFGLHSSIFELDEAVVPRMAAVFAQTALDYLQ